MPLLVTKVAYENISITYDILHNHEKMQQQNLCYRI